MEEISYLKEQLSSLKQMFTMTTNHLQILQEQLASKNNAINESVAYAENIQNQLLPTKKMGRCLFSEFEYEIWQRDKIGGDFIYLLEVENKVIVALMDCTGHGIPGALLSMLGYNFLNDLILQDKLFQPHHILDKLDLRFQTFFASAKESSIKDGMDGIICVYDKAKSELCYSMAGRPLWYKQNNSWEKHRPDQNSIGGMQKKSFVRHQLNVAENDELFLFSDGLADQFGGPRNKKFLTKRLLEQLKNDKSLTLRNRNKNLNQKMKEWQGKEEQTDDISYLAIRF